MKRWFRVWTYSSQLFSTRATLLRARTHSSRYCINGLGMLPDHRGRGGNAVLYAAITRTARDEIGMEGAEVVQVAEHNTAD